MEIIINVTVFMQIVLLLRSVYHMRNRRFMRANADIGIVWMLLGIGSFLIDANIILCIMPISLGFLYLLGYFVLNDDPKKEETKVEETPAEEDPVKETAESKILGNKAKTVKNPKNH